MPRVNDAARHLVFSLSRSNPFCTLHHTFGAIASRPVATDTRRCIYVNSYPSACTYIPARVICTARHPAQTAMPLLPVPVSP